MSRSGIVKKNFFPPNFIIFLNPPFKVHDEASTDYHAFLNFIGTKIELKEWNKYRGGLNIKDGSTGDHSYYTSYKGLEIMFHVATLLPYHSGDEQKLERKRSPILSPLFF